MKSLRALKAAGLVLAAVVLGLMTVQGSYALWNASAPQNAGTVQTADFNVTVNEASMAQTPSLALNLEGLTRGTAVYTSLRVTNAVNVSPGSPLVLQPAVSAPVPSSTLNGNLTVTTAVVQGNSACTAGLAYRTGTPALPVLATKATQTICFKVALHQNTPANLLGKPVSIPVNLSVAQLAPAA
ncbi:hypothetical protein MUK71_05235 [Arthrobacter zhangbolii]|uniref:Ribosomally synthesized peptide with SipW-like signal peptide n=1 Tax=Arthrobacter zhangbolii TaxID=2886936 RepID=A0A9X1S9Y3_9MICC|nr:MULTISPECIES: hypothetical protein [Arthrobacter]MCC3272981.1 hypothetical protein [Arthrobacter zhangbolii]MCC3295320.1 hypothetical protein [Arthrobacter zhangbolii]MDN3905245.1 hypothetical protein [Arthrobacter sp. YD2]UON93029.1 hypothetical protein MUK71_05235 [Arthrobacter zhangbolii]